MTTARERLAATIGEALGARVDLDRPAKAEHGDFATNVALQTAKDVNVPPRRLAEELAVKIEGVDGIERVDVAGPGFLNIWLGDAFFEAALAEVDERYGGAFLERRERVQVELVSANPTGPVVVSAARNGAYGDCVGRLLAFAGDEVTREYYYNDSGTQVERFRASVDALRRGEPVAEEGYRGEYVADVAAQEGDPVVRMLASIEATLERFRIGIDSWALQSQLEARLPEYLPKLDTFEREGAIWARSSAYGDDQDWVLIRSAEKGGTPTYRAADVVYLVDKLERGFDRAIYVLGADHHATAKWYGAIARMLGYDPDRIEVLLYQFVHLTSGGSRAKASKRSGDVVFIDDVMNEIGVDAARWYLVNRGPDQTIDIDLDLAAERTQKNPVYYVQYAHARIAGILRNGPSRAGSERRRIPLAAEEKELIKRLTDFPPTVREAVERRGPQLLPAYAIRLADDFHRFYHEQRVLGSDAEAFRLQLCRATQIVIARCLDLLGIEAPERM